MWILMSFHSGNASSTALFPLEYHTSVYKALWYAKNFAVGWLFIQVLWLSSSSSSPSSHLYIASLWFKASYISYGCSLAGNSPLQKIRGQKWDNKDGNMKKSVGEQFSSPGHFDVALKSQFFTKRTSKEDLGVNLLNNWIYQHNSLRLDIILSSDHTVVKLTPLNCCCE